MKNYSKSLTLAVLVVTFVTSTPLASAHPGRTDKNGGHRCYTRCSDHGLKYGEYHYHNKDEPEAPSTPKPTILPNISLPERNETTRPSQPKILDEIISDISLPLPNVAERIQTLRANDTTDVLWADIILEEAKKTPSETTVTTINPAKEATKRLTGALQPPLKVGNKTLYYVNKVTDGDTLKVVVEGKLETVRLLGIDTPETEDPRKAAQCFGNEATNHMQSLAVGKYVSLETDPTQPNRDKYDRLLRYAYLSDGTNLNAEMVRNGFAAAYVRFPVQQMQEFINLQDKARSNNVGLWAVCR